MRSTFSQPYDEEFARRCILECFPEFGWKLSRNKQDPPDVIDEEARVGIEVVRAVDSINAELSNTYARYKRKLKSEVPDKVVDKFEKGNARLAYDSEGVVMGASSSGEGTLKNILERITIKTEKLNQTSYKRFSVNALFVYNSGSFCFEKELQKISNGDCFPNNKQEQFQLIFIYCDHEIYLCDTINKKFTTRYLQDDDISRLKKDSLDAIGRSEEYQEQSEFLLRKK